MAKKTKIIGFLRLSFLINHPPSGTIASPTHYQMHPSPWDYDLIFVMAGAIAVNLVTFHLIFKQ